MFFSERLISTIVHEEVSIDIIPQSQTRMLQKVSIVFRGTGLIEGLLEIRQASETMRPTVQHPPLLISHIKINPLNCRIKQKVTISTSADSMFHMGLR